MNFINDSAGDTPGLALKFICRFENAFEQYVGDSLRRTGLQVFNEDEIKNASSWTAYATTSLSSNAPLENPARAAISSAAWSNPAARRRSSSSRA
jgi:hypothetical protein